MGNIKKVLVLIFIIALIIIGVPILSKWISNVSGGIALAIIIAIIIYFIRDKNNCNNGNLPPDEEDY